MPVLKDCLDRAIIEIDPIIKEGFPRFKDTVIETTKTDTKNKELWHFSTNKEKINAHIYKPGELLTRFRAVNRRFFKEAYPKGKNLEMLVQDNKLSLLIHEHFHKLCPDTPTDEKKVDEAICSAINKAYSSLPADYIINMVANSRNCVWDCVIDLFQYNYITYDPNFKKILQTQLNTNNRFPEGIIPLFDIVSTFNQKKLGATFYTLTRLVYSSLFCNDLERRNKIYSYFEDKIEGTGLTETVREAVQGFISEIDDKVLRWLDIDRKGFNNEVENFYENLETASSERIIKDLFKILQRTQTRYNAVEGFVKPLAHYISLHEPDERPNVSHQSGTSVLDNLIHTIENKDELLVSVANNRGQVSIAAADEFYKRNHKTVNLTVPKPNPTYFIAGQEIKWKQIGIQNIRMKDANKCNIRQIIEFGKQIGKKNVMALNNGAGFRVINYKQKTKDKYAKKQGSLDIDIVRNLVLLVDSSSSMDPFSYVNNKKRYDSLNRFVYGITEPLAKYCGDKACDVMTVRFSEETVVQGPCSIKEFYNTLHPVKINILAGNGGSTNLKKGTFNEVNNKLAKGPTLWTLITDGDILSQPGLKSEIYSVLNQNDHKMLYIELYSKSCPGTELKHDNLTYLPIKSFDELNQEEIVNLILKFKKK